MNGIFFTCSDCWTFCKEEDRYSFLEVSAPNDQVACFGGTVSVQICIDAYMYVICERDRLCMTVINTYEFGPH